MVFLRCCSVRTVGVRTPRAWEPLVVAVAEPRLAPPRSNAGATGRCQSGVARARPPRRRTTRSPAAARSETLCRAITMAGGGRVQQRDTSHGLDGVGPEPVAKVTGSRDCSRSQCGSFREVWTLPPRSEIRTARQREGRQRSYFATLVCTVSYTHSGTLCDCLTNCLAEQTETMEQRLLHNGLYVLGLQFCNSSLT